MSPAAACSQRHQFVFLVLDHGVDVLDEAIGELLDLVVGPALVVFGVALGAVKTKVSHTIGTGLTYTPALDAEWLDSAFTLPTFR